MHHDFVRVGQLGIDLSVPLSEAPRQRTAAPAFMPAVVLADHDTVVTSFAQEFGDRGVCLRN